MAGMEVANADGFVFKRRRKEETRERSAERKKEGRAARRHQVTWAMLDDLQVGPFAHCHPPQRPMAPVPESK